MIVTIDGTDWLYGERAIRRHVVNLLNLVGSFGEGVEYRIFFPRFRASPYGRAPEGRPGVRVKSLFCPPRLWNALNAFLPVDAIAGGTDLYHAAGTSLYRSRAPRYLCTVPGLCAFVRPDLLPAPYARRVRSALRRALPHITHFLAVSETTRRELMTILDVPGERVTAIPLGVDEEFRPGDPEAAEAALARRFPIRRPYALYVGGIQRNKNVDGLVAAFAIASRGALAGHQLVLAGPQAKRYGALREAFARARLGERVVVTGPQSGEDLVRLYAAADLFVFPTFYEGWTSPPLEAMACGVPVVASRASSVPETVGDAALLAEPEEPEDLARAMCSVVEDASLRSALVEKGSARAAAFTWERCIGATVTLYRNLCGAEAGPAVRRA